jgi:hypothetical protein
MSEQKQAITQEFKTLSDYLDQIDVGDETYDLEVDPITGEVGMEVTKPARSLPDEILYRITKLEQKLEETIARLDVDLKMSQINHRLGMTEERVTRLKDIMEGRGAVWVDPEHHLAIEESTKKASQATLKSLADPRGPFLDPRGEVEVNRQEVLSWGMVSRGYKFDLKDGDKVLRIIPSWEQRFIFGPSATVYAKFADKGWVQVYAPRGPKPGTKQNRKKNKGLEDNSADE